MAVSKWLITSAGVNIPPILYGTAWKKERTTKLVLTAFQAGFRGFDTACQPKHYAEALVGEALRQLSTQGIKRSDYYLQTKFTPLSGQDPEQVPYDATAPLAQQVEQSFAASQKNLQTEYLDGWILHSPLRTHEQSMTVWRAMEAIHQAGGTRQLGISNCYDIDVLKALYADARVKPAILQNRFYKETAYDAELRRWCVQQGIIYQSFWTLTANPHVLSSNTMLAIAKQYNKSPAQILFCYLGQNGIVPLTGTSSDRHMQEDLASFEFSLADDDIKHINKLFVS